MPQIVKEAYSRWNTWRVDKSIKKVWLMIPGVNFGVYGLKGTVDVLMGSQQSTPNYSLKAKCLLMLFSWVKLTPNHGI
ncbi:hypothetical protein H5410_064358 [Solanum commersonii]|uniref:Uncharacterized protein n=1 Tax=Solanum commersonii TaxID=4109 RepID=A0A9J5VZS6_SOLCO|nr:hypothetical protein H5410_064358 [Solanum commersonii]